MVLREVEPDDVVDELRLLIIHPLDDVQEQKLETEHPGPKRMTPEVKISLQALRGYLILMTLLVLYHVLELAGVLGNA